VERPFFENAIFCIANYDPCLSKGIDNGYLEFYVKMMKFYLRQSFIDLDIYAVLWCNMQTLFTRINERAREAEKSIPREYLFKLQKLYFIFILLNYHRGKFVPIDWNNSESNYEMLSNKILKKLESFKAMQVEKGYIQVDVNSFDHLDMDAFEEESNRVLSILFVGGYLELKGEHCWEYLLSPKIKNTLL
jgi:deoxyadenosine/deoxycytidine kinase